MTVTIWDVMNALKVAADAATGTYLGPANVFLGDWPTTPTSAVKPKMKIIEVDTILADEYLGEAGRWADFTVDIELRVPLYRDQEAAGTDIAAIHAEFMQLLADNWAMAHGDEQVYLTKATVTGGYDSDGTQSQRVIIARVTYNGPWMTPT